MTQHDSTQWWNTPEGCAHIARWARETAAQADDAAGTDHEHDDVEDLQRRLDALVARTSHSGQLADPAGDDERRSSTRRFGTGHRSGMGL